eukprot:1513801-Rhodomonas_salina.1
MVQTVAETRCSPRLKGQARPLQLVDPRNFSSVLRRNLSLNPSYRDLFALPAGICLERGVHRVAVSEPDRVRSSLRSLLGCKSSP